MGVTLWMRHSVAGWTKASDMGRSLPSLLEVPARKVWMPLVPFRLRDTGKSPPLSEEELHLPDLHLPSGKATDTPHASQEPRQIQDPHWQISSGCCHSTYEPPWHMRIMMSCHAMGSDHAWYTSTRA